VAEVGRSQLEASFGEVNMRPYLKNKLKAKRLGAQVVEHLLNKCEALSSALGEKSLLSEDTECRGNLLDHNKLVIQIQLRQ
jgi:hypothetical protein